MRILVLDLAALNDASLHPDALHSLRSEREGREVRFGRRCCGPRRGVRPAMPVVLSEQTAEVSASKLLGRR